MLTLHAADPDAAATHRALEIWLATGTVPVAHIVAEPDPDPNDEQTCEHRVAA